MISIRPFQWQRRAGGFTLIEVLLSVVIFAIVLAAINTVFFGTLRLRNKTYEAFNSVLSLQQAVGIIKRDLNGIMLPGGTTNMLAGQFQTALTSVNGATESIGTRVSPDIFTCTGLLDEIEPWGEVRKVAYFLAQPTNNTPGKDLIRSITHNLLPVATDEPVQQWLMSGVEKMVLQYHDGTTWMDNWDSTIATNLPKAIKVEITLLQEATQKSAPAPIQIIVPVMVQSSTNATAIGGS